jgi:murein DD-endopeptidase MepM/ murein hydrolase activator NlpD
MAITAVDSTVASAVTERGTSASTAASGFDAVFSAARAVETGTSGGTHRVKAGETLSEIVLEHLRSQGQTPGGHDLYAAVKRVADANGLNDANLIFPGQELVVDTKAAEASPSPDSAREILVQALVPPASAPPALLPDMGGPKRPVNFSHVRLESLREVASEITDAISHPIRYAKGSESLMRLLPSPVLRNENTALAALREVKAAGEAALEPVTTVGPWSKILAEPARLTSEFGPRRDPFDGTSTRHDGIDLAAKRGAEVYPMDEGVVKFAGWMPGYGNVVVVKHLEGVETVYGHNAKNLVKTGDTVEKGDAIATVGSSGRSTGPHLHFEIRERGKAVDPIPHLTEAEG